MKTIKIYCNYGVLAAEKRNVYTYGAPHYTATCWDEMEVAVPEGWDLYKNQIGEFMISDPWGGRHDINDVLQGNDKPCFYAIDKNMKGHRFPLDEI